jgi:methionyl-tRNA synthetase
MHALLEVVHALAYAVKPFLPDASVRIAEQLGIDAVAPLPTALNWGRLLPGHKIGTPAPLFARIEE